MQLIDDSPLWSRNLMLEKTDWMDLDAFLTVRTQTFCSLTSRLTLFLHVLLPKIYYFIKLQVIFRLFVCIFIPKISTCVHLADNQKQSYSLRCSYFLIYAHCIILWNQDQQTTISSVSHIQTVGLEVTPLSMFTKMRRPHIARSALQWWKWIRLFLWVLFLVNRAHL